MNIILVDNSEPEGVKITLNLLNDAVYSGNTLSKGDVVAIQGLRADIY